jgi:23S rRNA pseudouridine955/2504/2580 synthase
MKDLDRISGKTKRTAKQDPGVLPSSQTDQRPALAAQFVTIHEEEAGQRIDNYLLRICKGVPKSHIYRVLRSGEVRVNKGRIDQTVPSCKPGTWYAFHRSAWPKRHPARLSVPGAEFKISCTRTATCWSSTNRPALPCMAVPGCRYGVIEQLRAARPDAKFLELVHRLDRETSGVLLLAKKRSALVNLHEQMRDGVTDKRYLTLIARRLEESRASTSSCRCISTRTADGERRVRRAGRTARKRTPCFQSAPAQVAEFRSARSRAENRPHAPDPRAPGSSVWFSHRGR